MKNKNISLTSQIFLELSQKYLDKIMFFDEYYYSWCIFFKNWKKWFFRWMYFDINSFWASSIAKDKWYTKYFLEKLWYKVPFWDIFFSEEINSKITHKKTIDDGFLYAKKLWFPVIIKPNDLSQWKLVSKISNKKEYYSIAKKVFKVSTHMILEEFCEWNDYRILVLDSKVRLCYERKPLEIVWDWKKSILELINEKNKYLSEKKVNFKIDLNSLKIKKLDLNKIVPFWEKIKLLDNANLSTWWELVDYTSEIHLDFKKLAINIANDMWLRYCWIDIITSDITKPILDYKIIEVNPWAWFRHYLNSWKWNEKIVREICNDLYLAMRE